MKPHAVLAQTLGIEATKELIVVVKQASCDCQAENLCNLLGLQRINEIWQQVVDANHEERDISVSIAIWYLILA
ncbi:hypothetical protein BG74_00660 [Sodalis-like endosymbiont of Proechinophthirus fluctus]|uniref:hypothetical protein n=1 Tax=Sodalis-like endosymbiont of Proechinophthirus fluctus TaxID=1462730 RepID=UPI0007A81311|nr:hypothetical protein [Sodalis-like endosymbiont of Proechinophthirus fluctus]KYP97787.1 hypothetical protein BG74_00660 [Sodalis-like endosymbiont of Proechinophthirus fluctus]